MVRFRLLVPPPHFFVHGVQSDQKVTSQSTQQSALQVSSSYKCGQLLPPQSGFRTTSLVRFRWPLQAFEQGVNDSQVETWQSIGDPDGPHTSLSMALMVSGSLPVYLMTKYTAI